MDKRYIRDFVSVITPTFNSAKFIADTINSVRQQTFQKWEMVITDDCSSDNTCAVIQSILKTDSRIKLYKLSKNRGAAATRNNSLHQAMGQYVAFLDADDLWLPDKLENQLAFMKNTGASISFTAYREINENGKELNKFVDRGSPTIVNYRDMLKKSATMGCLTVMIDRNKAGAVEMPNIRTGQDYATWLQVLKSGCYAYKLDECHSLYRISSNSISRNKLQKALRQWEIYRKLEGLSILDAFWCFGHYAWRAVNRR